MIKDEESAVNVALDLWISVLSLDLLTPQFSLHLFTRFSRCIYKL